MAQVYNRRQADQLSQLFRILGDPSRLRIVQALMEGRMNVTALCRKLRFSQPTVSRHLSILKMARLAEATRNGKEIHYNLPPAVRRSLKALFDRGSQLTG